ncbi:hypothetical protein [Phenylobacterium deserti]|uniref:Fimbrial biogenesis outer membrane usher protein n=1 Tax=Phenylobacterium deserti TaxID=1914756 RepID=A0A328A8Q2_9CAUL|nr:hypothetical protein [Phenylobacterium deserti]RAK50859.1 hypothetical protein DJ018_16940 [Phenylobacterium deserti]
MRSRCCKRLTWYATAALTVLPASSVFALTAQPQAPPAAEASLDAAAQLDPVNLLLLSVQLDDLTLTDGLSAYGDPSDPLLPMGELTRLLELDVDVAPQEGRIVGRLGEARRALLVDAASRTARDGPRVVPLAAEDLVVGPTDIYLRASAVEKLLPLKVLVEPDALSVRLSATEPLPIQGRLERMARMREATQGGGAALEVMRAPGGYRLFTLPAFDVQLGAGYQTGQSPSVPFRYDIRAAGDLLYSGFQGYVGSDETGRARTARILFERTSVEGRLLGPLKARTVSLGDVFTPAMTIGPRGMSGRGISLSTVPLDETNVFNQIDLRGELPLGYDVELYVNDVLRGGQNTPVKGRYEFLKVPLTPGVNVIRVVTYGPRGERNEDVRVVNVGAGLLRRGQATFELGVVDQDEEIIRLRPIGDDDEFDRIPSGVRAVAQVNYGVTQYLTVSAGAALLPTLAGDSRQIYTAGARTSIFGFATNLDGAYDDAGGSGYSVGMAGQLLGSTVVLRHAGFRGGFVDENGAGSDITRLLSSRTEATLDSNIAFAGQVLPITLRALRNVYVDGAMEYAGSARGSASLGAILVSTGLEYSRIVSSTGDATQRLGGFFAGSTYRSYTWQIRSTLDYQLLPEMVAQSLAVTVDRELSQTASLRFGVGQSLEDFKNVNFTAASIFRLRFADLALTADYNNGDRSWRAGAQLSFGLNFDPARRRYAMTRPGPGSGGAVLFEAFLDHNGNGLFDAGDEPVRNVLVEGAERPAVTGPDGKVFISNVGAGPTAQLRVSLDNVENTSVTTPPSVIQVQPHPGSVTTIRYPMRPTGEVMVHVSLRRPDGALVGIAAVQLRLVGDNGHVGEVSTEFDGSANFINLPPGQYRLELDGGQAQRLRMSLVKPVNVTITGDGGFIPDAEAEVRFERRTEEQSQDVASADPQ